MSDLLHPATPVISLDEPCFMLVEEYRQSPGSKGFHRYQIITVVRNDKLVDWLHDMGPARKFKNIDQFRIPGGVRDERTKRLYIEHTVGELQDIANVLRTRPQMSASLPRTDLVAEAIKQAERIRAAQKQIFGAYQTRSLTRNVQHS